MHSRWTERQLREWVGDAAFQKACRLVERSPPEMRRNEPDFLEAVFHERWGDVQTMLQPAEVPERSRLTCTCPEFEEGPCRHAAALVLYALKAPVGAAEADPLQAALARLASAAKIGDPTRTLGFRLRFGRGEPLVIEACRLRPGSRHVEVLPAHGAADHPPPYADEPARALLDLLRPYAAGRAFVLPEDASTAVCDHLAKVHAFVQDPTLPLRWHDAPVALNFASEDFREGIAVYGSVVTAEGTAVPLGVQARIFSAGARVYIYDGARDMHATGLAMAGSLAEALLPGPLYVTPRDIERWVSEVLPAVKRLGRLVLNDTRTPEIVEVMPKPAVVLEECAGGLRVRPAFRYPPAGTVLPHDGQRLFVDGKRWYIRNADAERDCAKLLTALLLTEPKDGDGRWLLPVDRALLFLDEELPKLEGAWEIYGRDELKSLRIRDAALQPSIRVASDLDWFNVEFEFQIDDERFDGWKLLAEWDRGRRFVATAQGFVRLPADQLRRLRDRLAELPEGSRLRRTQAGLIAALLAEVPSRQTDRGWLDTARALEDLKHPREIPVPGELRAELRPYQLAGLNWIVFLAENHFGGVLADDMGLGKTLQAVAFLLHQKAGSREESPPRADRDPDDPTQPPADLPGSLVIAPSSVVFNWEREIAKFAPTLTVVRWTGDQRAARADQLSTADVVLTNYAILRRDIELLGARRWRAVILDEAQAIKNAGSQTAECARALHAGFRLALTGTPIENHLGELWSYFEFAMPGFFASQKHFNDRYIKRIENESVRARLRERAGPFILRRLKQNVAAELPPKTETIVRCEFDPAQRNAYESIRAAYKLSLFERIEKEGLAKSRMHVLEALLRLRQACCDPRLLPYEHTRAIDESAKAEALYALVEDAVEEDHKIIVFSQFTQMLDILEAGLRARGVDPARLDGSTADRETPVNRFQNDDGCKVILISLRAGGTGLNLTAADYVVHYDPWWNPAVEDQATDRAYRIGQTRPVFVYKLVVEGTVEETMLELQEKKRGLVDGLLGEEAMAGTLNIEDIKRIFE